MNYKLICIDMDGTLLNTQKEVSHRNRRALINASERGVKVVISSGRAYNFAVPFVDYTDKEVPIITANGALVKEKNSGKVLYKKILGAVTASKIYQIFRKYGILVSYFADDTIFSEEKHKMVFQYNLINKILPEELRFKVILHNSIEEWEQSFLKYNDDILKCLVIHEDKDILQKARREIEATIDDVELTSSGENVVEVNSKGVSKGRAVELLSGIYNIKKEEIICIGDGENDISMLQASGMPVAMKNAPEIVKEKARFITDSNDEDGVAKVIERFVLDK